MRLIDADARIDDLMERCCKECDKRKGMKNGKRQFIYEIGEVPCRACEVDDIKSEFEEAPTIDAVPVVRCKDCKYGDELCDSIICFYHNEDGNYCEDGGFCAWGERRTDGND